MRRFALIGTGICVITLAVSVLNCLLVIDAFESSPSAGTTALIASTAPGGNTAGPAAPQSPAPHRPPIRIGVDTYHTYSGFIHFHTTYSDGSGTYEELTELARSFGADFIMPADHNTARPFTEKKSGYRHEVLVIPAVESSADHGGGHFLVIGTEPPLVRSSTIPSDSVFSDAVQRGMVTILAHVHHPGNNDWENWDIGPFTGIEMFNLDENWRAILAPHRVNRLLAGFLVYPFVNTAIYNTVSYPARQLETFDRLNRERKVVGIGVTDAHSRLEINDDHIVRFPSYESAFHIVRTYLVTSEPYSGEYTHDRDLTLAALTQGNSFTGFPVLADPAGFVLYAQSGDRQALMGDSLLVRPGYQAAIQCTIPDSTDIEVVVLRDGEIIAEYTDIPSFTLQVNEPGAYRVEVFHVRRRLPLFTQSRLPFILSNPLYLYAASQTASTP